MRLKKVKDIIFDELTHSYICGDKLLIGVTSLMKKHGLAPDYSGIPADVLEKAAARGTEIHKLLEDYDAGKEVVMDDNLKAYKALGLKIDRSEYMVTDGETVASFIDKVYEDCSLADVKTTSTIHSKSVSWQLSIYAYLFELQNPGKKVPHLYCIHVRDGKAKEIEMPRIPDERVIALLNAEKEGRIYDDSVYMTKSEEVLSSAETDIMLATIERIGILKEALKVEEKKIEEMNEKLYQFMTERNIDEMACPSGKFVLKGEYTRTSIDSARLKKEKPEIYENFLKTSTVRGSVTYKPNI